MSDEWKDAEVLDESTWMVRRHAKLEEVVDWDESIRYVVTARDVGRKPFVQRSFRRRAAAEDFYDKLRQETEVPQNGSSGS